MKRGYENGGRTIEIYEGKVDLILYNNKKKTNFYYYRFPSKDIIGEELDRNTNIYEQEDVKIFLERHGLNYEELLDKLLYIAESTNMPIRDEM